MFWKIATSLAAGVAALIIVNRAFFPFDFGDHHLLKVNELRAAHQVGDRKLTSVRDFVTDPSIKHVGHTSSYTPSFAEKDAAFERELRAVEKFPPGEEGPDLFAFFDDDRKLVGVAYWHGSQGEVSTASDIPHSGIMSDYRDSYRCVDVGEGIVQSYLGPDRFYFSIKGAPRPQTN